MMNLLLKKIIKVWESFTDDKLSSSYDLKKFKKLLKQNMLKKTIKKILNHFLPDRFNYINKNAKFSNLERK